MSKKCAVASVVSLIILASVLVGAQEKSGLETIEVEDMTARIQFLADDALKGRDTFSPELQISSLYSASLFREWGLSPVKQPQSSPSPYLLPVVLEFRSIGAASTLTAGEHTFDSDTGFWLDPFFIYPRAGNHALEAVYVGNGLRLNNSGYDAFAGQEIEGKIVIMNLDRPGDEWWAAHDTGEKKPGDIRSYREALFYVWRQGAAGLIKVTTDPAAEGKPFSRKRLAMATAGAGFVYGTLTAEAADQLLQANDRTLADYTNAAKPDSFVLNEPLNLAIDGSLEPATSHNTVAMLEGSDPQLKNEFIIIGAHLDHVGVDSQGNIRNGADDNASGSGAVLEIAQAFASLPVAPKRTIIFALWTGEEKGLLGSRYFVENLPIEKAAIKAYLNLDMVGRDLTVDSIKRAAKRFGVVYDDTAAESLDNGVIVYTQEQHTWMKETIEAANESSASLSIFHNYTSAGTGGSDHQPFEAAGIPIAGFFTGFHEDYHQPTDTSEKINYEKATRITKLIYATVLTLANGQE